MSKITIKRFLNKKVKPIKVYDDISELGYPLYYSITYQRKTQYIKSFTGAVMTKTAFLHLEEKDEPYYYETNYTKHTIIKIDKEKELIYNAVKFITETEQKKDIFNEDFTPRLKEYFEPLEQTLKKIGWYKYNQQIDIEHFQRGKRNKPLSVKEIYALKYEPTNEEKRINEVYKKSNNIDFDVQRFYYIFNQEENLLLSIKVFENITGLNIKKYFYENTLKVWYVIDLITKLFPNAVMIEFVLNYDLKKLIELNKEYSYPVTNDEIKRISNKLKMNSLGVYSVEN